MKKNLLKLVCLSFCSFCFCQQFTVAVLPDTQPYTDMCAQKSYFFFPLNTLDILESQVDYIAEHSASNGGDIVFALHEGDVVEHWGKFQCEWRDASRMMGKLDGVVPYLIVPGNHDYDRWNQSKEPIQVSGYRNFESYFGPDSSHFKNKSWYGGSYHGGTNSWSVQNIDGYQILFLALELEPTDDTLYWAQEVINLHKGIPTVIVTHEFLNLGSQATFCNSANRADAGGNSPANVWNKFIRKNSQIIFLLCGHAFYGSNGEGRRIEKNDDGYLVHFLLSNYQGRHEIRDTVSINRFPYVSGDGWLRLMHFDLANNCVHVQTYSPYLDRYETDEDSDFVIHFDFDWKKRFPKKDMRKIQEVESKLLPKSVFFCGV